MQAEGSARVKNLARAPNMEWLATPLIIAIDLGKSRNFGLDHSHRHDALSGPNWSRAGRCYPARSVTRPFRFWCHQARTQRNPGGARRPAPPITSRHGSGDVSGAAVPSFSPEMGACGEAHPADDDLCRFAIALKIVIPMAAQIIVMTKSIV